VKWRFYTNVCSFSLVYTTNTHYPTPWFGFIVPIINILDKPKCTISYSKARRNLCLHSEMLVRSSEVVCTKNDIRLRALKSFSRKCTPKRSILHFNNYSPTLEENNTTASVVAVRKESYVAQAY
jgi:hypothetical protein